MIKNHVFIMFYCDSEQILSCQVIDILLILSYSGYPPDSLTQNFHVLCCLFLTKLFKFFSMLHPTLQTQLHNMHTKSLILYLNKG